MTVEVAPVMRVRADWSERSTPLEGCCFRRYREDGPRPHARGFSKFGALSQVERPATAPCVRPGTCGLSRAPEGAPPCPAAPGAAGVGLAASRPRGTKQRRRLHLAFHAHAHRATLQVGRSHESCKRSHPRGGPACHTRTGVASAGRCV